MTEDQLREQRELLQGLKVCASMMCSHWQSFMQEVSLRLEEIDEQLDEPHIVHVDQASIRWPH